MLSPGGIAKPTLEAMFPVELLDKIYICFEVFRERERQDAKFGKQHDHTNAFWAVIFGEEVGEVSRAIIEDKLKDLKVDPEGNMREEIIQCMAVCLAWIEALDANAPEEPE